MSDGDVDGDDDGNNDDDTADADAHADDDADADAKYPDGTMPECYDLMLLGRLLLPWLISHCIVFPNNRFICCENAKVWIIHGKDAPLTKKEIYETEKF